VPTPPLTDDELLSALQVVSEYGSVAEAARRLNMSRQTLQHRVGEARRRNISEEIAGRVPDGQRLRGVSTLYDAEGAVRAQWVKTDIDREKALEALQEAISGFKGDLPHALPVTAPAGVLSDLCNLYTFTDYHLGCLAWHKEGGQDWDVQIAERTLLSAMSAMVAQSPKAHTAVINIQGDFLHTDGKLPVTPASHHVLDADSRFPKIRRAAIRLIRELVRMALESHSAVRLIIAEGNHDEESAGWLADCFAVHYELEPRVSVDDAVLPFYCFEWGETMLGVHHGHKVKNESLPLLFAAQFPEAWGRTKRREIHCGHRHHRDEKEYNGVTVIQHPTLAARDAYAARGGWIADRAASAITYHRKWGQVGRVSVCPEMLEAA
jgi:DNA-binding Lrp family transcriptional regulator